MFRGDKWDPGWSGRQRLGLLSPEGLMELGCSGLAALKSAALRLHDTKVMIINFGPVGLAAGQLRRWQDRFEGVSGTRD